MRTMYGKVPTRQPERAPERIFAYASNERDNHLGITVGISKSLAHCSQLSSYTNMLNPLYSDIAFE